MSALKCRKKKKEQFESLIQENDTLKKQNEEFARQIDSFKQSITFKDTENQMLKDKLKKYSAMHTDCQASANSTISEDLHSVVKFNSNIPKASLELNALAKSLPLQNGRLEGPHSAKDKLDVQPGLQSSHYINYQKQNWNQNYHVNERAFKIIKSLCPEFSIICNAFESQKKPQVTEGFIKIKEKEPLNTK